MGSGAESPETDSADTGLGSQDTSFFSLRMSPVNPVNEELSGTCMECSGLHVLRQSPTSSDVLLM